MNKNNSVVSQNKIKRAVKNKARKQHRLDELSNSKCGSGGFGSSGR
jgi:dUTPase